MRQAWPWPASGPQDRIEARHRRSDALGGPSQCREGGLPRRPPARTPTPPIGSPQDVVNPSNTLRDGADSYSKPGKVLCAQIVYDGSHPIMTTCSTFCAHTDHSRREVEIIVDDEELIGREPVLPGEPRTASPLWFI